MSFALHVNAAASKTEADSESVSPVLLEVNAAASWTEADSDSVPGPPVQLELRTMPPLGGVAVDADPAGPLFNLPQLITLAAVPKPDTVPRAVRLGDNVSDRCEPIGSRSVCIGQMVGVLRSSGQITAARVDPWEEAVPAGHVRLTVSEEGAYKYELAQNMFAILDAPIDAATS